MKTFENPQHYTDVVTIAVDEQNDFALATGLLSVKDGEEVIEPTNNLTDWTRAQGGDVVFTADWHPEGTKHFAENGGTWPVHCVQNTEGAALHKDLVVADTDLLVRKGMSMVDDGYSGFEGIIINGKNTGTGLAEFLQQREQEVKAKLGRLAVIVVGIATEFCDKATVFDGIEIADPDTTDFIIATDAMRAVNLQPGDGDAAIKAMVEAGAIAMTTQEIIAGGIVIDDSRLER